MRGEKGVLVAEATAARSRSSRGDARESVAPTADIFRTSELTVDWCRAPCSRTTVATMVVAP